MAGAGDQRRRGVILMTGVGLIDRLMEKKNAVYELWVDKGGFAGILQGAVRTRCHLSLCKPTLTVFSRKINY